MIYKNTKTFSITYNLTGCEVVDGEYYTDQIAEGTEATIEFNTLAGYTFNGVQPVVTGASIVDWDGIYLTISNPTDNVVITISANKTSVFYNVIFSSDYAFSIDGNKSGTYYKTTYVYNPDNPPNSLSYEISMDNGIDSVVIGGTHTNYDLSGNYGDTVRVLTIYGAVGGIHVTITGVV